MKAPRALTYDASPGIQLFERMALISRQRGLYSNQSFLAIPNYIGTLSQSPFSKVFKQQTETTPFEYRQMHKHY